MADDVVGLMDFPEAPESARSGWSDGAILGLDIAQRHPERLARKCSPLPPILDPSVDVADIGNSPVFNGYIARAGKE